MEQADSHRQCGDSPQLTGEANIIGQQGVYRVDASRLQTLQSRPALFDYCRQIWDRRFYIWTDARFKALRTTKDYRLWRTWLVLQPLLDVAFYAFLFGFILKTSRGIENFIGYLILGVIFMRMMVGMLNQGSMLIRNSKGMIKTFQFPRAALPISQSIRSMLDNILPAVVAVIMALASQSFHGVSWTVILVVPLYLMLHLFGCGLMLTTARLTAEIPDSKALLNFASRVWFFLSGIMFSIERFVDHPILLDLMTSNPAYIFLTAIRDCVIYGSVPALEVWGKLLLWALGTFAVGLVYFWRAEAKYVRLSQ